MDDIELNILAVSNVGYTGGAETVLIDLIQADSDNRYIVLLPKGDFADQLTQAGIHVITNTRMDRLQRNQGLLRAVIRFLVIFFRSFMNIKSTLNDVQADVIYANSLRAGIYCFLPSKITGIPLVWHIHDIVESKKWAYLLKFAQWVNPSIHFVCVSSAVLRSGALGEVSGSRVIYNGINTQGAFWNLPASAGNRDGSVKLLAYGRILPWKGYHILINALPRVLSELSIDIECVIMGDVSDESRYYLEELKKSVTKLGLDHVVKFSDGVSRAEVSQIVSGFDIVVHTATKPDPFPTVVLESMALGRMVVASDSGGTPEMIESGVDGFRVRPNDAYALSEGLIRAITLFEEGSQIGDRARQKIETTFDIRRKVKEFNILYRQMTTME